MAYINWIKGGFSYFRDFYNQINPATLTGAIDIVVVEQPDGSYIASPFHVRFGKLGVLRAKEKLVRITVNDVRIRDLHMKLGDQGEAFFVEELTTEDAISPLMITSPLPSRPGTPTEKDDSKNFDSADENSNFSGQNTEEYSKRKRRKKRKKKIALVSQPEELIAGADTQSDDESKPQPRCKPEREEVTEESKNQPNSVESAGGIRDVTKDLPLQRGFLSDSELPTLPMDNTGCGVYSDSETVVHHSPSELKWGWGQLPGGAEPMQDSSSDDSASSTCGTAETARTASETHFRTIIPHADTVEIIDEKLEPAEENSKGELKSASSSNAPTSSSKPPRSDNGLYLDDVLNLAPSEADLYLQCSSKHSAREPSNNADLLERAVSPGGSDIDSGTDSQTQEENDSYVLNPVTPEVELSLCGFTSGTNDVDKEKFLEKAVNFEVFIRNPASVLNDPNLVFKIGSRYMNWQSAAPVIVSLIVFKRQLSNECVERLVQNSQQPQQSNRGWWFGRWRSRAAADKSAVASRSRSPSEMEQGKPVATSSQPEAKTLSEEPDSTKVPPRKRMATDNSVVDAEREVAELLEPEMKRSQSARSLYVSDISLPGEFTVASTTTTTTCGKVMRKTTRLTPEQLESLNLKQGANDIVFSVTTQYQGTTRCQAVIYLWKWTDKIVVSDIDGTITRSDVFGQILPLVGKDWSQVGVAQLYQNIDRNGYKFIYLSARAIGQASMTKESLNMINQEGVSLPPGPLFLSPTSLMIAFRREVIEKKPEKFKIECLRSIKSLFPSNPFTAGFGNKTSDVTAYTAVGIPSNRLFTINHKGELRHEELPTYTTTYSDLGDMVDNFFPPLDGSKEQQFQTHDYSDFSYWREDIIDIADALDNYRLS